MKKYCATLLLCLLMALLVLPATANDDVKDPYNVYICPYCNAEIVEDISTYQLHIADCEYNPENVFQPSATPESTPMTTPVVTPMPTPEATPWFTPVTTPMPTPEATATATPVPTLEHGVYSIEVETGSASFQVIACTLAVQPDQMIAAITLSNLEYDVLYTVPSGDAEYADESAQIHYHVDADGRWVFVIPVSTLDAPMELASHNANYDYYTDQTLTFLTDTLTPMDNCPHIWENDACLLCGKFDQMDQTGPVEISLRYFDGDTEMTAEKYPDFSYSFVYDPAAYMNEAALPTVADETRHFIGWEINEGDAPFYWYNFLSVPENNEMIFHAVWEPAVARVIEIRSGEEEISYCSEFISCLSMASLSEPGSRVELLADVELRCPCAPVYNNGTALYLNGYTISACFDEPALDTSFGPLTIYPDGGSIVNEMGPVLPEHFVFVDENNEPVTDLSGSSMVTVQFMPPYGSLYGRCQQCEHMFAVTPDMPCLILPDALTVISSEAFTGTAVQAVILPASIQKIETGAFANCPDLQYIVVSEDMYVPWNVYDHAHDHSHKVHIIIADVCE